MDRIPAVRRSILAHRSPLENAGWTVLAIVLPVAFRWAIDRGLVGVPLITVLPAVLLASLFLGWPYAIVVAAFSGALAYEMFGAVEIFRNGVAIALLVGLYGVCCAILILTGETVRRLLRRLDETVEREALLNRELRHRVKNILSVVHSLAAMTARHSAASDFVSAFSGRLTALNRATDLLGFGEITECQLRKLVNNAVTPFQSSNISAEGPACELPRDACVPLSLALHELCTNAVKYGALSSPEGRVLLSWHFDGEGQDERLVLIWQERDGPPVEPPERSGMGSLLLRPQNGLKAVDVRFDPEGVECRIEIAGARRVSD